MHVSLEAGSANKFVKESMQPLQTFQNEQQQQ